LTPVPDLPLGRLAAISPYFALGVADGPAGPDRSSGSAGPNGGWLPVTALLDGGTEGGRLLDQAIDSVAARLAPPRRWIAASILFQGWAARLTSGYAGCLVFGSGVPDLAAQRISYRPGVAGPIEMAADPLVRLDADAGWRRLLDDHLRPLADAFRSRSRVSRRILEGNIASALGGSLVILARTGHGPLADLIARPWAQPPDLAAYGDWVPSGGGPRYVRTTCCGYERIPGGGRCGDCSLRNLAATPP
jgi:hypothetical protein